MQERVILLYKMPDLYFLPLLKHFYHSVHKWQKIDNSLYYYLWLFGNFYGSKSTIQVLGPRIWVPKIKMHKKEVEPWLWTQYLGPNKCPKG